MEPESNHEVNPASDLDSSPTDIDELERLRSASEGLRLLERLWPRGSAEPATIPDLQAHPHSNAPDPADPDPDPHADANKTSTADPPQFGRFRIVRELGRGGFGVVFLAIDSDLGRPVALKVPRPEWLLDAPARERFVREARAIAALDHPGIAPLYEAGELHGVCYMASAYCEGPSLSAWLRNRRAPAAPRTAARIVARLADAVAHAHQRGVLHRDLKPSNILLARPFSRVETATATTSATETASETEDYSPRIVDFGLARLLDQAADEVTVSFAAAGTAPYMAPEQAEGLRVGPGADVYGLGAVLYSMLCGRPPHRNGTDAESIRRAVAAEIIPPRSIRPELPRDLEAIALKCLEKDPARRYASAGLLRDDLQRYLDGLPTLARSGARWNHVRRVWSRYRRRLTLAAMVGAVGTALFSGVSWYEDQLQKADDRARAREKEAREVRASARRAQYNADLRQARLLLDNHESRPAIAVLERHRPGPGEDDLREFSWRYLRQLSDQSRQTLRGFRRAVYSVEFSPSGDRLAAASQDGTVRLWETGSWQPLLALRADRQEANAASFSPDGRSLATVGDEGTLRLWDLATGLPRFERPAHRGDAVIARFAPGGRTLLTGGRKDGQIALWDLDQGTESARLKVHPGDFEFAAFSHDGRFLVTTGSDRVRLWDVARQAMTAERFIPGTKLQGASFSRDGRTLALASEGKRCVLLLDLPRLEVRRELDSHLDGIFAVAFSADDRTIYSAGEDGLIRGWDASTGGLLWTRHGHDGKIWGLTLSPDGRTLASASGDGTVKLWDAGPPLDHDTVPIPGNVAAIRLSADGRQIATLDPTGRYTLRSSLDGQVLESRDLPLATGDGPSPRPPIQGVIADDLRTVLMAGADGRVSAFDGKQTRSLTGPASGAPEPLYLKLDAAGRRGLIGHTTTWRLECWEIPSARRIDERTGPYDDAYLFPDGRHVAIVQKNWQPPVLWEPGVAGVQSTPPGKTFNPACLAFSPDGRALAHRDHYSEVGHHAIVLRETERLSVISTPIHCATRPWSLAFDPTGRTLAGGCEDLRVHIWDVATGEELLTLENMPCVPGRLQYLEDGRTLAAILGRPDGTTEACFWRTTSIPD